MARLGRGALGAEVDPRAVGRVFGTVIGVVDIAEPRVGTTRGWDGEHVYTAPLGRAFYGDVGKRQPIGRDAVQVIVVWRAVDVRDAPHRAAADGEGVDVPVIVAAINGLAIGREHMVVVEVADPAGIDLLARAGAVGGDAPEFTAGIEDQMTSVRGPVGRLDDFVGFEQQDLV